ncbi:hypothetical protein B6S44_05440 [Bosea sp. Tri-44]|uniref:hypothetical protein n=1 Tax=Bosea sp. Tri-44 TaxID=1972137 RepID=UPI00100F577E|nr:hypothetical protein [Bosea sp. Tri-44]RXT56511.1 hypothetical protein B6S44_05440 [Bosea sp. Tri-44]
MPGFDTLGVRLARSRRRLERERAVAAATEQSVEQGLGGSDQGDTGSQLAILGRPKTVSAQVIAFPRSNERVRD